MGQTQIGSVLIISSSLVGGRLADLLFCWLATCSAKPTHIHIPNMAAEGHGYFELEYDQDSDNLPKGLLPPSLSGSGCAGSDSTGLGVHTCQRSLLILACCWLAARGPPRSGCRLVLRLKTPVGSVFPET